MWLCFIHGDTHRFFQEFRLAEFGTVIEREGLPQGGWKLRHPPAASLAYGQGTAPSDGQQHQVAAPPLDHAQECCRARPDQRISFPIPVTAPLVHDLGTVFQGLGGLMGRHRAPPASPFITTQKRTQRPLMVVGVQPIVDQLTRELTPPILREFPPTSPGNLLRRPALLEPLLHILYVFRVRHLATPLASIPPPFLRQLLCLHGTVNVRNRITLDLTADRSRMPMQLRRNRLLRQARRQALRYHSTFLCDKLNCHCWDSV